MYLCATRRITESYLFNDTTKPSSCEPPPPPPHPAGGHASSPAGSSGGAADEESEVGAGCDGWLILLNFFCFTAGPRGPFCQHRPKCFLLYAGAYPGPTVTLRFCHWQACSQKAQERGSLESVSLIAHQSGICISALFSGKRGCPFLNETQQLNIIRLLPHFLYEKSKCFK